MRKTKTAFIRKKLLRKFIEIFIPAMIAALLGIGFIMMTGNAFSLYFNPVILVISVAAGSLILSAVHSGNNLFSSIAVIVLTIAAIIVMVHFDILHLQMGQWAFLYYVKRYVYYGLPGDYPYPLLWKESVLTFLIMYDLIAASVTTLLLSKRKWILVSLIFYLPLLWCSIANVTVRPAPNSVVIATAGVIMLLFAFGYRKKEKKTSERALLVLAIPVLLYSMIVGLFFPIKFYKKDRLANDILYGMRSLAVNIDNDGFMVKAIDKAINGNEDPHPLSEKIEYNPFTSLHHADNDLTKVGPFDPPEGEIMTVYKDYNRGYLDEWLNDKMTPGDADFSNNLAHCYCLYLKVETLDTYKSNRLSNAYYTLDTYAEGFESGLKNSPYSVRIEPLLPSDLAISPYYHELYMCNVDPSAVYTDENNGSYADKLIFSDANAVQDGMYIYPLAGAPVNVEGLYDKTYEEAYVYGIATAVPDKTRDALISSGMLPDWYMDIYNETSEMSDCDKVRAVTEYVRSLHPYDVNTAYQPEGSDFVPWFVTEAESGICVHYAATTVILLRMIGIPARYVRGFVDPRSYPRAASTIYASQSHGWFEFYVPGYGWIMGDSTPGMEKYAQYYDIDAVAAVYPGIEDAEFSRSRFDNIEEQSSDEKAPDATAEAAPEEAPAVEEDNSGDVVVLLKMLLIIVLVTAFLKLVWWAYWKIRFSKKDMGSKILEHYYYYNLMSKYLMKGLPGKSMEVVYKVTFSHEDITADDLKTFIKASNKGLALVSARLPIHKKLLFRLISFKVRS